MPAELATDGDSKLKLRIQLCQTSGVRPEEFSVAEVAIVEVLRHVRAMVDLKAMPETCDADSWVQRCVRNTDRGYGNQVDCERILKGQLQYSLITHALTSGAFEVRSPLTVVLVDTDVTAASHEFLFGASLEGIGSVVSVMRLRAELDHVADRSRALRRLVCHEFGHTLGLVPKERASNVEDIIGLHCANLCVMRQALSLSEFSHLAIQEEHSAVLFCSECADYLRGDLRHLEESRL